MTISPAQAGRPRDPDVDRRIADAANVASWFTARGLAGAAPGPEDLAALLREEAGLR